MSDLRIRLLADLSGFRSAFSQAQASVGAAVDSMTQRMRGVGNAADESAKKASDGFGGVLKAVGGLASAYAALNALKSMARISDETAMATARINGLTGSTVETAKAQQQLFDISQRLQVPYAEAVSSFARMLPAVQAMGGGVKETTRLTDILVTTAKLSGSSATEAAASAQQFAQALGSGMLAGDELKSILENNSTLARSMAAGLGVSVGELRRLGSEGKLTSDLVANTLLKSYDDIKSKAGDLPVTVGGAWTQITNSFTKLITSTENSTGIFAGLVKILQEVGSVITALASTFSSTADASEQLAKDKGATEFAQGVGRAFAYSADVVKAAFGLISAVAREAIVIFKMVGEGLGATAAAIVSFATDGPKAAAEIIRSAAARELELGKELISNRQAAADSVINLGKAMVGAGAVLEAYNAKLAAGPEKAQLDTSATTTMQNKVAPVDEAALKKQAAEFMAKAEMQLDAEKLAYARREQEMATFQEYSKAQETAFWEQKLQATNLSAQERLAIEKKLTGAELGELAARNKEQLAAQLRLADSQSRADAIYLDMAANRAMASIDLQQAEAKAKLDNQEITQSQYLAAELAFEAQRFDIANAAAVEARNRAIVEGRDPEEVARLNAQLLQQELQFQLAKKQIQLDQAKTSDNPFANLMPDSNALQNSLSTMLDATQSWGQKVQGIYKQISAAFTQQLLIQPLSDMMMRYIRETALYKMLFVQQTTGQAAASATVTAIKAGEATAVVGAHAAEAASGAAAAVAPTPFIGPALAIGAFAAVMAMVLGAKSSIKSARGGYDIPAGLNPVTQLHAEEMVLPAEQAETIRQLSAGGGGGGNVNIEVKGESVGGWLLLHKSELAKAIKAANRGFAFA